MPGLLWMSGSNGLQVLTQPTDSGCVQADMNLSDVRGLDAITSSDLFMDSFLAVGDWANWSPQSMIYFRPSQAIDHATVLPPVIRGNRVINKRKSRQLFACSKVLGIDYTDSGQLWWSVHDLILGQRQQMTTPSLLAAVIALQLLGIAAAIPYSQYILAPSERCITPVSVYSINGTVHDADALTASGTGVATFAANSNITYDHGKDIGGLASFTVSNVSQSDAGEYIGISFTESSLWISPNGSDATANVAIDEIIWFPITGPGFYTLDAQHSRGGFRYLNLYHNSTGTVTLSNLTTYLTSVPTLQNYTGYFHADDDEKLNRVWYAAAYTNQLCTIPADEGNSLVDIAATNPDIPTQWWSNSTLTNGSYALVDGAKRDKLIWPGDFGISVPAVFLSTNDIDSLKVSIEQLFAQQNVTTGQMPYAAAPIVVEPPDPITSSFATTFSFTYGLHGLLSLYYYYKYTGDVVFVKEQWDRFKLGLDFSLSYIDSSGLAYIPIDNADWLRNDMGWYNIEVYCLSLANLTTLCELLMILYLPSPKQANSILVYTLRAALSLAEAVSDFSGTANWTSTISGIETAANDLLWNSTEGLFRDNENNTTLFPQDGNVWSIISGVANSTQAVTISNSLRARWGPYGAPAPEAGNTVSPFISGYELQAHFLAGQPQNAIDLMRFMWADFMLDDPRMTNSTFIEGYDISGALHYPAYADDARISHAHGWSTGPLTALSTYLAGLQVLNSTNWIVYPRPGDLSNVEAGFELSYGSYAAILKVNKSSTTAWAPSFPASSSYWFSTPEGSTGSIILDIPRYDAKITIVSTGRSESKGFFWTREVNAWVGGANPRGISFWGPQDSTNGTLEVSGLSGGSGSRPFLGDDIHISPKRSLPKNLAG
ncbi:hypothetical protein UA08_06328 [Talaromyces atroroseus]|uniref:Alpha-L-rhamnosidase six-hairpin glycosidase domain-containing protein n=1 Tax=Talaromyces atroroseus TaxID=1441469 RepID=A0A225AYS7_TALAT|nr:hypothetical protein UA08_06328 [Talaromyces atroroseus]OKL58657.1 hypothetical protein UA08_06328 [Talaromyces atroroseus]